MDVLLQDAGLADAALIARLTRDAWSGRVAAGSTGHRESAERVAADLQAGGGFILLVDDAPAGSVRWLPADGESAVWEIVRMGILPAWRGRQLSEHLLEAIIHQAQEADIAELRLAVRHDQPRLLDLYAAYGFELAPELEYSRANPAESAPTMMRRFLKR
nr:GNAT family N-acetyltransferase [uncultured Noviherbaspirillum sp.]